MDFKLSEELVMLRDMVRDFATEQIAPLCRRVGREALLPL